MSWHLMLELGVLATALPITLLMHLIRNDGPTKAAMIGYLMPVFTNIMAVIFLGEEIGLREMIGGSVVLAGVYVVTTAPHAARS
jgi:drug/metabolite transporter (DMT)-like permease